MSRFITSAQWGANPSKDATADSHPIGSTKGVTLHWTGPAVGIRSHADCAEKVRGIERYHEYGNGWGDIAYNLLVCPHGYIYEGRGAGVRSAANGTTRANEDWYAVCYLGGVGEAFTTEGKAGMLEAVGYLRREGNAGPAVNGHRDHKSTECPGDAIYDWLGRTNFAAVPPLSKEDDMPDPRDFLNEPLNVHEPRGRIATRGLTVGEALQLIPLIAEQIGGPAADALAKMRQSPATKE